VSSDPEIFGLFNPRTIEMEFEGKLCSCRERLNAYHCGCRKTLEENELPLLVPDQYSLSPFCK